MLNANLVFFPIFGGVLRTAAKNRNKCLMKTWYFFGFFHVKFFIRYGVSEYFSPAPRILRTDFTDKISLIFSKHFFQFLAAVRSTPPKIGKNAKVFLVDFLMDHFLMDRFSGS